MSASRSTFPWSDQQITDALGYHAIPDPDDERIVRELALFGASQILGRRKGGRTPRVASGRGKVRRILISVIFEGEDGFAGLLPPRLRKNPTSPATVTKVHKILGTCGWKESEATILNDIKKIGTRNLRGT